MTKRIIAIFALLTGIYVLAYLYFTEGGLQGISKWIFPTGIVGLLMLALGIRAVIKEFKPKL